MLKTNAFKTFLTTAILATSTANALAAVDAAEQTALNSIAKQLIVSGNVALWVFAFMGLVMAGIGARRILAARSERRNQTSSQHYKYSEGIWRVIVGTGLIVIPVYATFIAPTQIG